MDETWKTKLTKVHIEHTIKSTNTLLNLISYTSKSLKDI